MKGDIINIEGFVGNLRITYILQKDSDLLKSHYGIMTESSKRQSKTSTFNVVNCDKSLI